MRRNMVAVAGVFVMVLAGGVAAGDWPAFRGPNGDGDAGDADLPVSWSETENVVWKTAIPHVGWSTPTVLEGRVWVTTATAEGNDFHVLCLDVETGEVLFQERLFHCADPEPLGNNVNGYASPSVALEPGRAYIHFGTYGTACLDSKTKRVLWRREDIHCRHYRGPGSSPFIFEDLLILSMDGVDVQYMIALNKDTGETVWRTDRTTVWTDLDENGIPKRDGDARKAFSTPRIFEVDGKPQLFSLASSAAYAYDPYTGKELWKVAHEGHSSSPSPLYYDGLAYVLTGYNHSGVWAVRVDGAGDVTDTHVAWRYAEKTVPQTPSPLIVDGLMYLVSNQGAATCLDAKTGAEIWSERIGGSYMASPIHASGRLYCFSSQGRSMVLKAGRTFELLAENELDEGFLASPAVAGDALLLRTKTHLYRIENKE